MKNGTRLGVLVWVCLGVLTASARAEPLTLVIESSESHVTFTLDATAHTVEGSFAFRSGNVTLEPTTGSLSGEIVVDLTTGKTGNDRRDKKMHEEVLESGTYPVVVLRPTRMIGRLPADGEAEVTIEGTLALHGSDHAVALPARVTHDGGTISVTSEFSVPYVEWGLEDPSFFVLRVAKEVAVRIEMSGALSPSPRPSTP